MPVSPASTLVELLEERAALRSDAPLFHFVEDTDGEESTLPYSGLLQRARSIGACLQQFTAPGERAVLLYPPGLEYVSGFFGCLASGVVAVPAYPPDPSRLERTLPRLRAIIQDCQASVVLTTSFILSMAEVLFESAPDLRALRWVATDELPADAAHAWRRPALRPDSLAFLQYTSGSTGTPKGVMLSHANLLHNLELIHGAFGMHPGSTGVIWLPPYHDMGLIGGILGTLYGGFSTSLLSPLTFLRRPMRWLEVLSRTHGTISGGPNFAFDLCVRKTTEAERAALDLSHWEVAFCGAEPIRPETLERFAQAFAPSGFRRQAFYPCYGLAEGTLIVSGGELNALPVQQTLDTRRLREGRAESAQPGQPHGQTLVGCGHSLQEQEVRVVHPETLVPCAPGEVGEVWVKGPSVALGYWSRPEDTVRDFQARTSDGAGPFLRTGDQGFLQGEELFITGRIKDLIIVRGRNHHPQDIELTAEHAHAALRPGCGAAFSVEVEGEERLVVVYEADTRRQPVAVEEVARAISQQVATAHELRLHALTLIAPGSLAKTSSGKIQRRACRASFLSGELQEVASWREQQADVSEVPPASSTSHATEPEALPATPEALEDWLRLRLARQLKVAPREIERDAPLTRYGIDSLAAVELTYEVEKGLGVALPLHVLLEGPTLAELALRLAGAARGSTGPMTRASREQPLPLSFAQQRLWFLDELEPGSSLYNIPAAVRMRGVLDTSALERTFTELVRRHESLRTTVHSEQGRASQVIHPEGHVALARVDLGATPSQQHEAEVLRLAYEEALRPFELTRGPLLRTTLLRLSDTEHVLLLCMHHIVSDGWSMGVLVREVAALYAAFAQGLPSPLPELPVQYADYALWQRQWLQGEELERQLSWWKQQLTGAPAHLELPTDNSRPPVRDHRGASVPVHVPVSTWEALKALAQREGVTPFMLLLAAFQVVLHRHSGEEDISVGSPIAGRSRPETQGLIGFFVNTLVLRTRLEGNPSFRELLHRVRETTLGAFAHQDVPFEKLVEQLRPVRDLGRSPLFQVMLVLQPNPLPGLSLPGLTLDSVELESRTSRFDLQLALSESAQGLAGSLEYATDLFEPATMVRLVGHLRQLLEGVLSEPEQRIAELPLLTNAERQQVLVEWNDTRAPLGADTCIHHLFEAQVRRAPDAPALGFEGSWLSYRELDARSNQLAHHLRSLGVGPEVRVGLCAERSLELVVGLFAILKAGGAYVPLDPSYPRQRLEWMLEDARPAVILAQPALLARLPEAPAAFVVPLALEDEALRGLPTHAPASLSTPDSLAYVIFTSGSTGRPKGAMNAHRAVCNRLLWIQHADGLGPQDIVLQKTPYSFDVSVWEFFWPLTSGARLVLARPGGHQEPDYLVRLISEQRVTITHFVPSMLQHFLEQPGLEKCSSLRRVMCSGEALSPELAQRCLQRLPSAQLHNLYGPTEAAVEVTAFHCLPQHGRRAIPIGRPIANTVIRLLDAHLRPVPAGVPGELFIGGIQVGRGYLARPELTAERFIPDPFASEPGARLYRTGDKARWLPDGNIEYLGRLDFQVKVRGLRIELGEIEAALELHPQVRQAVVVVREDSASGDKRLVAYIVAPSGEQAPSITDARDFLKQRLPEYMVPSAFVSMEALPLNSSGKLDRKALPAPDLSRSEPRNAYVAPRNDVEQRLCDSWAQVLGLKQVGIHDNFFELGGDSIISLQVVARARQTGLALSARQLFQHQTVEQLALVVESASEALSEQGPITGPVPLTPVQHQQLAHDPAHAHHFNQAVLLASREPLEPARLEKALARVVTHHDALRLRFRQDAGAWLQDNASPDEASVHLLQVDLSATPASEQPTALEAEASRVQASFVLAQPPLLRAALFQLGNGQQRLLLVAHHLVVDAVSWRVILEDLESAYLQATLPAKSTSLQSWARRLQAHAHSEALLAEAPLWLNEARAQVAPLPTDASGPNTYSSERSVSVSLDAEETKLLLQEVPSAWRARINDVLLTALARALSEWTGQSEVLVHLEGHGREELFTDVDLSRTVGWFTSFTPVLLPVPSGASTGESLRSVRDSLRLLPHHGIGFGLLKWLGPTDIAQRLQALPSPQVAFNYLGQLDASDSSSRLFSLSSEPSGPSAAPASSRPHVLEINGSVLGGQLQLAFGYSTHLHHAATIGSLAGRFLHHLRALISLRASEDARRFSPGDFPLAALSQQSLDSLVRETGPDIEDVYPLSPTQQGMLFHALLSPESTVYFMQHSWAIHSALDSAALHQAWQSTSERLHVLRTSFHWQGLDAPLQVVHSRLPCAFEVLDWRALPASEQHERYQQFLLEERRRGFELRRAPLMRMVAFHLQQDVWRLHWSHSHLLLDGWSLGLVLQEFFSLYDSSLSARSAPPATRPPFRDYLAWLRQRDGSADASFWRAYLSDFSSPTPLPADTQASPPPGQAPTHPFHELLLSAEAAASLQAFSRQHQLTLNTLALAAWALVLSRYSGEHDVLFGTTFAGRPPELPGSGSMVGIFINSLPTRVRVPSGSSPLLPWLQSLQAQQLELRQYEHSPLVQVQALSQVPRGASLFESLLVVENYPIDASLRQRTAFLDVREAIAAERSNYPLALAVIPGTSTVRLLLSHDEPRFSAPAMQRLLSHWRTVLECLVARPEACLDDVSLLSDSERRLVLEEWSRTPGSRPEQPVHRLIEAHARLTPDAPALCFGEETLTYGELNDRANQLARHLRRLGVGPEILVALCLERSLDMVVAMLATLKAGGAWLPLDPTLPSERLDFIASNALSPVLLTHSSLEHLLDRRGYVFLIDEHSERVERESTDNLDSEADASNLAYVIYTSGSTGRPKGTLLTHGGLANTAREAALAHGYRPDSRVLQFASANFDASVCEVFSTLVAGACLVLASQQQLLPSEPLRSLLLEQSITAVTLTPSVLAQLEPEGLPHLQTLISAGESCSPELARRWSQGRTLLNAYGPTEVTICATISGPVDAQRLSIGRALPNVQVYVLDERMRPVAVGVAGELYVGGAGLARGYHSLPALTAERFVPHPFATHPGERLYRTGDKVRWLPHGELEFLGRLDEQVKLRGFRIEPGEVEMVLREQPSVREALVVLREDVPGDKRLVAYVLPEPGTQVEPQSLRTALLSRLPEYMVPASFVALESLPLNSSGKVDKKALPAPSGSAAASASEYAAPRTDTEVRLASIWREVLNVEQVGLFDEFMSLGGHSLLATQVVSRIRASFGVELPLRTLFEATTLEALASAIESSTRSTPASSLPPLRPASREEALPLSFAQQRLWFLDELEPGSPLYNIRAAVRLRGVLDTSALERTFAALVRRHESLRTTVHSEQGRASQIIHPEGHVALARVDLSTLPPQQREAEVLRLAYEEALRPFELTRGPLLRTTLLRLSDTEHVLLLCMHHIVSDGWSMGVLVREVAALYAAFAQGLPSPLPELPVQYADYALWQRQWLQGEELERQLSWWKQQLTGAPAHLELPTDNSRPPVREHRGASVPVHVPASRWEALKALAQREEVTPFMVLLAAFQVVLHRHSGEEDISVGSPIAGRRLSELEGLIGFFVNTLVLRTRLDGNPSFRELLHRVRETTLGSFAHQDVPFEKLVEQLRPVRDLGRSPLFQVMLAFQPDPLPGHTLPGLTLDPMELESRTSRFDLHLSLSESAQGLAGSLEYATDLFEPATMVRLVGHLQQLLEGVLARPEQRIAELPLLTNAERQQVLVEWNDTAAEFPANTSIHHLFEAQVRRTPDAPALGFEDSWLSYRQLDERANQLAWHLRSLGVGPEVRVGLCAERSLELVVGLFAILKAGGAYVPLDPSYPRERLEWMLEDSRPAVLLAQPALLARLPEAPGAAVVPLALGDEALRGLPTHAPDVRVLPDTLAYVIFTSGSTGRPKGAMNAHRAVCNRLLWMQHAHGLGADDVVLQKTPYSFDVSVWEFFWPLMVGARLVVARPGGHQEPDYLVRLISEQRVTTTHFVPSMLQHFLEQPGLEKCSSLRRVVCSGEALSPELTQRCLQRLPSAQLHNLYGPTEAAVDVTAFHCLPQLGLRSIPIGRPISNTVIRLLDAHLRPVPTGVPGELFIGGVQVGRGYLARPELTAERFIPDPFASEPGARLYRTGDKARWLPDGNIEYLGRLDFQVKVRGLRIELGEIEAALELHPQVRQAVVVVREDSSSGDKRLVAYVVPPSGTQAPDSSALRDVLKQRLPEYMVPSAFVALEALPLNSSGKLDRKALPAPDLSQSEPRNAYVAPRDATEQHLCDIWAQVLGLKQVGIHDNFFELGGDSIISLQVVARARQAGLVLATRQLFQHQTVAQLALVVKSASEALSEQGPIMGSVLLAPAQHQLLAHDPTHAHHFNQTVLLASREPLEPARLEKALAHVVAHHDALRLHFRQDEGAWSQENASPDEAPFHLLQVDLSATPASEQLKALEAEASRVQASFLLSQPPLLRAALFQLGDGQQRLLLVAHHLVIDGVSWRVLLEDLESAYLAVTLPAKTTSFQSWARRLQAHAHSEALLAETPLWLDAARAQVAPLPTDASGPNTYASERSVSVSLAAEETKLLLQEVPSAWRAHINDVLLTALAQAVSEWTGQSEVLVHLEGHGREELFDDVDLSRTVGWFTSFTPVLLPVPSGGSTGERLRSVRDSLRLLPHHGIGFGLLKWLGPTDIAQRLQALPVSQVAFNYLGQLDTSASSSRLFSLSNERAGVQTAPSGSRLHVLEVNGSVLGGQLQLSFSYSAHLHHAATIESLAGRFLHHLRALISLRASEDARRFSPGDFPLAALSQQSLDTLLRQAGSDVEDVYPLSATQQGMLFHALLSPSSSTYFEQLSWTVTSSLDLHAFIRAWQACLQLHTILRSSFHWEGLDTPLQVVHSHVELPFELLDWSSLPEAEQHARFEELLLQDRQRGFELRRAPLMRLTAVRLADNSVRFLWSHHHLLVDGWSLGVLMKEVFSLYDAFRSGSSPLPTGRPPFRDYIAWLQRRDASADESFWRTFLDGFSAPTPLPADTHAAPPRGQQPEHSTLELGLSTEATASLQAFARQHQLTLHTLALASWGLVLSHYSGEQDVVFGNTVAGRPAELPGSDTLVGIFINTLPTRIRLPSASAPTRPWLQSLQAQQLELRQYEHSPLVQVQSFSALPTGTPLFESLLVFENYPLDASLLDSSSSLQVRDIQGFERTNYPLTLSVLPGQALRLRAVYDSPRFESASMQRLLGHWRDALLSLSSASRLGDVSLLSDAERHQVLVEWNDTRAPLAVDTCIHHLFEAQVRRTPDAPALGFEDSWLSYRELDARSNQLAWHLRSLGVGPEVRVGLCAERSLELVVGLFAILKAGGAYVPLDPSYPRERLEWMLDDSRPAVLLTQPSLLARLPEAPGAAVVPLALGDEALRGLPTHAPDVRVHPDSLAYVIFTSGSTGRPKGAMNAHRAVCNRLLWMQHAYGLGADDVVLQKTPYSFDVSVWEFFWPLMVGARLVVARPGGHQEPDYLVRLISEQRVTTTHFVPSMLQHFLEQPDLESCSSLRRVVCSGEALSPELTQRCLQRLPSAQLHNLYGPTEAAVDVTAFHCLPQLGLRSIPIGRPISNTLIRLLDANLRPVPVGVPGELFIGGIQVGRGYLARPKLTAERFIPDPFASEPGARLYRTGDKARWLADGNIEYLGRLDFQVKVRGLRIELGEIEGALELHPQVRQAVVVVREDSPGDKRLVAYVVAPSGEQAPDSSALRDVLKQRLPEYMVPSAFVSMEALPLNSSGKLDRKALPAPDGALTASVEFVAPRTPTEQLLASQWSLLLKATRVGARDNFFELGGHSLLATQVISRIRTTFGVDLPISALFAAPTLEALAASIDTLARQELGPKLPSLLPVERTGALPLSFAQQRLWFLDQLIPDSALYNMPAPLRLEGTLDTAALERSLTELVRRHEVLRTSFPAEGDQPLQVIAPPAPLPLERVDLSALPAAEREDEARRLIEAECRKPFSLARGPLLRALLLKLADAEHVLLLNVHHIISDGWSLGVLVREVAALYEAFSQGQPSPLPELPVQYADFAAWQRQWLQGEALEAQFSYWRQQLAGSPQVLELPTDRPRPATQ
ncbi:non-ribosomal peptide synthase/polyketide synthase, partial [Pyxidicoccus trucidator]|uniref:non-ribosomal peptide synthase/polyketide synthase n=1 Tax=Pyxidicoccus trucidator TaxID=2709662 RepID=UPI0013DAEC64